MDKELQIEARKQYLKYFRFWFIAVAAAYVFFLVGLIAWLGRKDGSRTNQSAPAERVYDYAEVLTEAEEEKLRLKIAEAEKKTRCDIVLVTINQEVGSSDYDWERNMRNLADDFYDENSYGYNKVHGDGVLLLDNWYEGQGGSWLSTCGSVYEKFGDYEINKVLYAVYEEVESSPFRAYSAYIDQIVRRMSEDISFPWLLMVIPVVVMLIFVAVKMKSSFGENTVSANTYVAGGRPNIRAQSDQLARKFVTKRHIPRPSNNGGGGGGRGGGHVNSGGVRHGGGGMRR